MAKLARKIFYSHWQCKHCRRMNSYLDCLCYGCKRRRNGKDS